MRKKIKRLKYRRFGTDPPDRVLEKMRLRHALAPPEKKSMIERFFILGEAMQNRFVPPPYMPAFNLPIEGWSADMDVAEDVLERLKKKRTGKVKKVKLNAWGEETEHLSEAKRKQDDFTPLLDWSCMKMSELLNNQLKGVKGKTSLDLSHNPLSELPISIGTQSQLVHLSLHDCDFENKGLPHSFFSGLANLAVLDLSCNVLSSIPEEFGELRSLRKLVAHSNRLESIHDAIGNCLCLEHIEVQHNLLTSLPPGLIRLRALAYLDAEHNKVDFLPIFFGRGVRGARNTRNMPTLRRLNLGCCHLFDLPPGLPGLDRLDSLWMHRNYLSALPEDLGDMHDLKQLCAYGNRIASVPESVSGLVSLQTLALNDNMIGPLLPETMCAMTSLISLDLSDNQLHYLPNRLGEAFSLRHLWAARNQLQGIPDSLARLSGLESLQLHNNKIESLPSNVAELSSLRTLTLSKNNLNGIPSSFRLLANLERLTLDHNVGIAPLPENGLFLTQLRGLNALGIDKIVLDEMNPVAVQWLHGHVHDIKTTSSLSKAKMRAHLFGDATATTAKFKV